MSAYKYRIVLELLYMLKQACKDLHTQKCVEIIASEL